jgi:acyl-CoA dehydrogenase
MWSLFREHRGEGRARLAAMNPYVIPWMDDDLEVFRDTVVRFIETEMVPHDARWREQHHVDRETWRKAGDTGLLLLDVPADYGGGGGDFRHEAVMYTELSRRGIGAFGQGVHSMCAHYVLNHGTEAQKKQFLPRMAAGELIGAICMTEPGTGSDLKGIRSRAVKQGDTYVVDGGKTFITNGFLAGLLMLVVRTDADRSKGLSILMVETKDLPGYRVGRVLDKMGLHGQDTSELFFEGVKVPVENLLGGEEGRGMHQLMHDLPYERTVIAVGAVGAMEGGIDETLKYVRERKTFGQPVWNYQNTRFKMAELASIARIARVFSDRCVVDLVAGKLDTETASMAKWWCSDMQQQVLDECVQLHGGYGYMNEYLVCRLFADSRVQRIYGGTNEIMKEVIARGL